MNLKIFTAKDNALPAKILWYIHLRCQTFLQLCSETQNGEMKDSTALDWEDELRATGQGLGSIANGQRPHFLHDTGLAKHITDSFTDSDVGRNQHLMWRFKSGKGRNIEDIAHRRQISAPTGRNGELCLNYHLRGNCSRGNNCQRRNSHRRLYNAEISTLHRWADNLETPPPRVPQGYPPNIDNNDWQRRNTDPRDGNNREDENQTPRRQHNGNNNDNQNTYPRERNNREDENQNSRGQRNARNADNRNGQQRPNGRG